jgi:hypothetical protein
MYGAIKPEHLGGLAPRIKAWQLMSRPSHDLGVHRPLFLKLPLRFRLVKFHHYYIGYLRFW